jgi:lipocalin
MGLFNKKKYKGLLPIVCNVDLERYLGTWYEIARYPHRFEKGLEQVTATYQQKRNGKIRVLNEGVKRGVSKSATGTAWVEDSDCTGRLLVKFFPLFKSPYNIVKIDQEDYQYAVVVGRKKKNLWILSRTPVIDKKLYKELVDFAVSLGYKKRKIRKVNQNPDG